jgi:hypothetical protein
MSWENKKTNWGGEFSTQRQVTEKITTEQSLDIIEDAARNGIKVNNGNARVVIPQGTTADGQAISLRVREVESANKANPPAGNPFLNKNKVARPAQKNLSDLP